MGFKNNFIVLSDISETLFNLIIYSIVQLKVNISLYRNVETSYTKMCKTVA